MNGETNEMHPYQGTLLSNKKGETADAATWMHLEGLLLSGKNSKGYMLYDCIYLTSWNDKSIEMESISDLCVRRWMGVAKDS